jgi:hypothetical protein
VHHGNGAATEPRRYQLIRHRGPITERAFEVTFPDPGAQAHACTFGQVRDGSRRTMDAVTAERFLNTYHNGSPPPSPDVAEDLASLMLAADRVPAGAAEPARRIRCEG